MSVSDERLEHRHQRQSGRFHTALRALHKPADHRDVNDSNFCSPQSGFVAGAVNRQRPPVAHRDYLGAELHVVDIPRTVRSTFPAGLIDPEKPAQS